MADFNLQEQLLLAERSPTSQQRISVNYINSLLNGGEIPTALSPMIQLLEASSIETVVAVQEFMAIDRRSYPKLANMMDDLYPHMSDWDLLDRFAQPAAMKMTLVLPRQQVIEEMKLIPGTKTRKMIIPRYTRVLVNDMYAFTLLYPIEIRQLPHTGLQIVYNTDISTSIQVLSDNVLDWEVRSDNTGRKYLAIDINLLQLDRKTVTAELTGDTLQHYVSYNDNFHAIRCFVGAGTNNDWKEVAISFSDYIYDSTKVTALVRVDDSNKTVRIRIPPTYIYSNLLDNNASLRFDVYTTKGPLEVPLANITSNSWTMGVGDDKDDPSLATYSGAIGSMEHVMLSTGSIFGGRNGLSVDEMRESIIGSVNTIETPITPTQVSAALVKKGFDVVLARDDLTDRLYQASKTLAASPDSVFTSAIASGIMTLQTTFDSLVGFPGVHDNGDRITISPQTLFTTRSGILALLEAENYPNVLATSTENLVNLANDAQLAYSPFHYVLDGTNDNFALRPYYLDAPSTHGREFKHENESAQLSLSTYKYELTRNSEGWLFRVTALAHDSYLSLDDSTLYSQIAFKPTGESGWAYLNGTFVGKTTIDEGTIYLWEYQLKTNFDIDSTNSVILDNFSIYSADVRSLPCPLSSTFMLLHAVNDYTVDGLERSDVDDLLGSALLPDDIVGLTAEQITFELGTSLDRLWSNERTLGGEQQYQTWSQDILKFYKEDVYEMDATGKNRAFTIENGDVVFNKLHSAGDPVLNEDGTQQIEFGKGTTKLDEVTNEPIPVDGRPTLRLIDLFLIDGIYYYINDPVATADRDYIASSIIDSYLTQLEDVVGRRLEKTGFYLYPKKTLGNIKILVDDAREYSIEAGVTLEVTVFYDEVGYKDTKLQEAVNSSLTTVVNDVLKLRTVSLSEITKRTELLVDENVLGMKFTMYSGSTDIDTMTMYDESYRATVKRLAKVNPDGLIGVQEDIRITPKLHLPTELE